MNPQPKQQEALRQLFDDKCKYLLYGGAMAGGKSYFLRWAALKYSMKLYQLTGIRNIPIGLFSEDYPTLKDRQISRISREFPKWLGELKNTEIDGLCFFVADEYGGGRIMLRNLDDPSKYMSSEFAGEFVEELTRTTEQTFQDLRNRLRYPGVVNPKFVAATNPGGIGHGWVKKLFVDRMSDDPEQDRFFYVHANVYDNKYVSPTYVKQLESLPERKRKAYLEGSWDLFEGQFFSEWNPNLHVIPSFIPRKPSVIVGGLDWGRAKPFAFELEIIEKIITDEYPDFYRAKTFLEVYGTEKSPSEWSEIIEEKLDFFGLTIKDIKSVRCDNMIFNKGQDMSKSIADQFYDANPDWRGKLLPASKDRAGGWEILRHWLSLAPDDLPYWQVAKNCTNLIRTMPLQVYDENIPEDIDTEGEDHCLIPGTKINTITGNKNIEDIKIGDKVLTRSGYKKVIKLWLDNPRAKVFKVIFSNGSFLIGTANHPVWVKNKGFVLIDSLRYNDRVCNRLSLVQQFRSFAEKGITYAANTFSIMVSDFILLFGNITWERSDVDSTFTTGMRIGPITVYRTYSALQLLSTYPSMVGSKSPLQKTWLRCKMGLKNGIAPKMAGNGTDTMAKKVGKIEGCSHLNAHIVAENMKQSVQKLLNSVIKTVKRLIVDSELRVLKVEYQGISPVYNLEVENSHEFFANGILVHNSEDAERYLKKHLKWIDAKAQVLETGKTPNKVKIMWTPEGKELPIDISAFEKMDKKSEHIFG